MIWDSIACSELLRMEGIKWKKFFEAKFDHDMPFVSLDIADLLTKPYVCNYESLIEEEIICYP